MSPADEAFDPDTATQEELTLFLARQGVSPVDLQRSLEKALTRVKEQQGLIWVSLGNGKAAERPWEEFELERI